MYISEISSLLMQCIIHATKNKDTLYKSKCYKSSGTPHQAMLQVSSWQNPFYEVLQNFLLKREALAKTYAIFSDSLLFLEDQCLDIWSINVDSVWFTFTQCFELFSLDFRENRKQFFVYICCFFTCYTLSVCSIIVVVKTFLSLSEANLGEGTFSERR